MLWVFLIISQYFIFLQSLLFPLISGLFRVLVHWDLLVHWQPVNEEKERKRRNLSHTLLHSHTARALCTDSEIMREKKREREGKRYGQSWGKKKNIEKKGEYGELPFWEYWVLPRNIHTWEKARKYRLFAVWKPSVATKWQHYLNYCKSKELTDFLRSQLALIIYTTCSI